MADKKISELTALTGALNVADALPISDDSASQTKKINPKALIEQGVLLIADGSIPSTKIDSSAGLPAGSIDTNELADGSVTAAKLADNSSGNVDAALPAAGIRIGQVALETTSNKFYCWDGSQWVAVKAAGSVNTITTAAGGLLEVVITPTGDTVEVVVNHADTTGAAEFLAGPTANGGAVSARPIIGEDLPIANASTRGAVSVVGDGLRMDGDHLEIDNDITPSSGFELAQFDSKGLAISTRAIDPADLPIATDTSNGVVKPGPDMAVAADGSINPSIRLAAGSYTKVTVSDTGLVTAGAQLTDTDLPTIDGSLITGNPIDPTVIGDHSIETRKLADYCSCLMQEDNPGNDPAWYTGLLWYKPSSTQLFIYARGSGPQNIWLPVADFGQLQNINLRWGGGVDADTGLIAFITNEGQKGGFDVDEPLPLVTEANQGTYFIVTNAGNNINIGNVQNQSFTVGDWCLAVSPEQGWIKIDVTDGSGGSGGGALLRLGELLDVDLGGLGGPVRMPRILLAQGQFLKYDGSGTWVNSDLVDGDQSIIKLQRANTANPPPHQNIRDGELVMRTDPADPAVYFKDTSNVVHKLAEAIPPGDGKLVFKGEDGSDIAEFTANQDTNLEVDVTIPTQHWTDDGSSLKTSPPDRSVECGIVSLDEAGHRGVQLKATGRIEIQSFASSADSFVIFEYVRGRQTGGDPTEGVEIQMRANGDAFFHGTITAHNFDLESLPSL